MPWYPNLYYFLINHTDTLAAQGRIKLAWDPWHIFRAGPLALVVGVGSGGRGGGGVEVALVEGKIGSFVAQTQSVIENI